MALELPSPSDWSRRGCVLVGIAVVGVLIASTGVLVGTGAVGLLCGVGVAAPLETGPGYLAAADLTAL